MNSESIGETPKILAVDDNDDGLFALESVLLQEGYRVVTASNGKDALRVAERELPDLIILDVNMPQMDGYETTEALRADPILRFVPVLLLTANDEIEDIVRGLEAGADDYIHKPFQSDELLARVRAGMRMQRLYRELEKTTTANQHLREQLAERSSFSQIIGKSAMMRDIYSLIERVKDATVPVLISGESGTGKELVARAIHFNGARRNEAFVVQNCSAFNENLLESELFGHVRGAFTGAMRDKRGLFEEANGGTFFLDEMGEMSLPLQAKLLRVLQDGTFIPVGDTRTKKVDVRIVAATNRHLEKMVKEGTFREDLYYRLNVVAIALPPLRDRRVDVPLLVDHFLEANAIKAGTARRAVTIEALRALCDYDWPGNIRQLQNEIERMVLMSEPGTTIGLESLSPTIRDEQRDAHKGKRLEGQLKDAVENLERAMIRSALEQNGNNKSVAAKNLGISRSSLISKVKLYGLES